MYTLIVENEYGEKLNLTECGICDVLKVTGLNPPPATINTKPIVGVDGSKFNSSRLQERNITILLNIKYPIESNRQFLYRYFRSKRWCRLYYKNDSRDVYIDGYTESFENDQFTNLQKPLISVICPKSFFKNVSDNYIEFSSVVSSFEFPFSIAKEGVELGVIEKSTTKIIDGGEVESGGVFSFVAATDRILNPVIYNRTTQKYFGLNFDMNAGDKITINTNQGEKSVTLLRNGVESNIIRAMQEGSSWIQFIPGKNEISYSADEGADSLIVNITNTFQYEGV